MMFADDQYIVIHINSFTQLNIYAIYMLCSAATYVPTRVAILYHRLFMYVDYTIIQNK